MVRQKANVRRQEDGEKIYPKMKLSNSHREHEIKYGCQWILISVLEQAKLPLPKFNKLGVAAGGRMVHIRV